MSLKKSDRLWNEFEQRLEENRFLVNSGVPVYLQPLSYMFGVYPWQSLLIAAVTSSAFLMTVFRHRIINLVELSLLIW